MNLSIKLPWKSKNFKAKSKASLIVMKAIMMMVLFMMMKMGDDLESRLEYFKDDYFGATKHLMIIMMRIRINMMKMIIMMRMVIIMMRMRIIMMKIMIIMMRMTQIMMITKVGSRERQHGIEKKVKSAPVPVRDMVKYNQKRLDFHHHHCHYQPNSHTVQSENVRLSRKPKSQKLEVGVKQGASKLLVIITTLQE